MKWALWLALTLALAGCDESEVGGVLVTARTPDGDVLRASYLRPESDEAMQTLLLIHQPGEGHSRRDFDRVWDALAAVGYGLLAIDLRSHGSSDDLGEPADMLNDPQAYTRDLDIWLEYIEEREVEGEAVSLRRTGIVGLGASGSLAAAAVATGRGRCAIAYSPSIRQINTYYGGWQGETAPSTSTSLDPAIALHDTFWLAADGDDPANGDAPLLQDATAGATGLEIIEGIHHGQELLEANESTLGVTVDWCADKL